MNAHLPIESEYEKPTAILSPPLCTCLETSELCPDCAAKLADYDILKSRMRAAAHEIATLLGTEEMPIVVRGKLRVIFTEHLLRHIPRANAAFWEKLAQTIIEKEGVEPA